MVTLSCNATVKPIQILLGQEWGNVTDRQTVENYHLWMGFYVISNASKSSDETYSCKASSGVGNLANQTTEVIVERKL